MERYEIYQTSIPISTAAWQYARKNNQSKANLYADYLADIFAPNPIEGNDHLPLQDTEIIISTATVKEVQKML